MVQVFVDSLPHVPAHRRLTLLTHLLTSVGAEGVAECQLHTAIGLLLEKQVVGTEVRQFGSTAVIYTIDRHIATYAIQCNLL